MKSGIRLGQWPGQPPKPYQLKAVIRSLAEETDVVILDHAEERMVERDIDMIDVLCVLKSGDIVGPIQPGISDQEWKCKMTAAPRFPESTREIGVVTIVVCSSRLLIATVEWEDFR